MKYLLVFLLCMLTWVVFSGLLDPFHLSLGVFSSIFVTIISGHMLFRSDKLSFPQRIRQCFQIAFYALWLLKEIFLANIHILSLAFHPRVLEKLNPRVFSFRTVKLSDEFSRYVMGISITLVPGTVTMAIEDEDDEFIVHAITDKAAAGLPDPMESKVARIFCPGDAEK